MALGTPDGCSRYLFQFCRIQNSRLFYPLLLQNSSLYNIYMEGLIEYLSDFSL